jgi:hypothetical protein
MRLEKTRHINRLQTLLPAGPLVHVFRKRFGDTGEFQRPFFEVFDIVFSRLTEYRCEFQSYERFLGFRGAFERRAEEDCSNGAVGDEFAGGVGAVLAGERVGDYEAAETVGYEY